MKTKEKTKLQKKIEKYCEEHSYLFPFDDFWYEKGWEDCEKIKDKEFLKVLDNIEKEAWMLADMDEEEFWTTQTITQEQAIIQAKATTDVINGIKQKLGIKENYSQHTPSKKGRHADKEGDDSESMRVSLTSISYDVDDETPSFITPKRELTKEEMDLIYNDGKPLIESKQIPKKIKEPVGFPSNLTRVCAGDEDGN